MKKPNIAETRSGINDIYRYPGIASEVKDAIGEAWRLLGVLDRIHEEMDGEEWSADTTGAIGDILTSAGFEINPPGHYDEEEE